MSTSKLELFFAQLLRENKIKFVREVKFHPTRKWRFDFVVEGDIAIEIDGGVWGGRHTRGGGFIKDMEKLNNATLLGYRVLRYYNVKTMQEFINHYKILKKGKTNEKKL